MSTKHLYASADGLVLKSLRGAVALNPSLGLHEPSKTVFVLPSSPSSTSSHPSSAPSSASSSFSTTPPTPPKPTPRRVALISGGGSGHEPAHAGYTGRGMLAASVAGDIFASPSAKQVLCAVELAAFGGVGSSSSSSSSSGAGGSAPEEEHPRDVLAVINNYTGDILNFGLAIEKARLLHPSLNISSIVVADDVALLRQNPDSLVGPRGLGANVLVCKILGALAEYGPTYTSSSSTTSTSTSGGSGGSGAPASLSLLKAYGDAVTANLYSLGVGLDHRHVPGHGRPAAPSTQGKEGEGGGDGARLGEGECEVGLGLHNEPGVHRRPIGSPEGLLEDMVRMLLEAQMVRSGAETLRKGGGNGNRKGGGEGEGCVLFVNNLGGMSALEMGAVVYDVLEILAKYDIHPKRVYSSSYMTSLNAPGFSLSLLDAAGIRNSLNSFNLTATSSSTTSTPSTTSTTPQSDAQENVQLLEELAKIDLYDLLDAPTDATAWVGARRWDGGGGVAAAVSERRRKGGEEARRVLESARTGVSTSASTAAPGTAGHRVGGGSVPAAPDVAGTPLGQGSSIQAPSSSSSPGVVENAIRGACKHVLGVQQDLTEFDTLVGDGDCGDTFAGGASGLLQALDSGSLITQNVEISKVVSQVADVLEDRMGGTIGALFAIFLNALSAALSQAPASSPTSTSTSSASTPGSTPTPWPSALTSALSTLSKYTPAQPGDRTIMDTLVPFCASLSSSEPGGARSTLEEAVKKARKGAERTRGMRARMGRAVYVGSQGSVGEGERREQLPPDPGAWGVAAILEGVLEGVRSFEGEEL